MSHLLPTLFHSKLCHSPDCHCVELPCAQSCDTADTIQNFHCFCWSWSHTDSLPNDPRISFFQLHPLWCIWSLLPAVPTTQLPHRIQLQDTIVIGSSSLTSSPFHGCGCPSIWLRSLPVFLASRLIFSNISALLPSACLLRLSLGASAASQQCLFLFHGCSSQTRLAHSFQKIVVSSSSLSNSLPPKKLQLWRICCISSWSFDLQECRSPLAKFMLIKPTVPLDIIIILLRAFVPQDY